MTVALDSKSLNATTRLNTWVKSTQAAEILGITRRTLTEGLVPYMEAGKHYKFINPTAQKKRYLFHVERCKAWHESLSKNPGRAK